MKAAYRAGLALVDGLQARRDVCIHVESGLIESIESPATCPQGYFGGPGLVALPQPGIAHAHSGDHLFPEAGYDMRLQDLVAPPSGLKHRLLAAAPRDRLVEAIREYYSLAWRLGAGLLVDFREGGGEGCLAAKEAASLAPEGLAVVVLGRPGPGFPEGCDGVGLPSALDYDEATLRELASRYKPSMVHVAETPFLRESGDLERALEAGFTGLVHGTFLSPRDLDAVSDSGAWLVLCVRSNMWHGLGLPPVAAAAERVERLALGTDNAAWTTPNPWRELEAALLAARLQSAPAGEDLAAKLLDALLVQPYLMVGERPRVIAEGAPARFLLFNVEEWGVERAWSSLYALAKRLGGENLVARVDDGEVSLL